MPTFDAQKRWGIVALVALIIVSLVWFFLQTPKQGIVSATRVDTQGQVAAFTLRLDDFSTSTINYRRSIQALNMIAAVDSPDLTKKALLYKSSEGTRNIAIETVYGATVLDIPEGIPDVPQWSKDSTSIAFSEITSTSSDTVSNPDKWIVVRAVPSGDALIVGNGYRPFSSSGQRTFALTSRGIELLSYQDQRSHIVVESPVPVLTTTPFAVSEDGMRIAWVAPADRSLQVFENVNGYFVPLLLKADVHPQSIVFSPDGAYILAAEQKEKITDIYMVRVNGGKVTVVGTIDGAVTLHSWRYEK